MKNWVTTLLTTQKAILYGGVRGTYVVMHSPGNLVTAPACALPFACGTCLV